MSWTVVAAIATGVTAVGSIYAADKAHDAQYQALQQAKAKAKADQLAADEANNKASSKSPDVSAMLGAAALSARSGQSGTLLTGPQGIDPSSLTLGKTNLLGGGG